MFQKKALWQGLTFVCAFLLSVAVITSTVLEANRNAIDNFFGTVSEAMVSEDGETYSTFLPDKEFLNEDGSGNATALIKTAIDIGRRHETEGAVLLKNNGGLPVAKGSKVTLLGARSHRTLINSGMGQKSQGNYITLEQALSATKTDFENTKLDKKEAVNDYDFADLKLNGNGVGAGAGYQLNPTTIAAYEAVSGGLALQQAANKNYKVNEPSVAQLTAAQSDFSESLKSYNDAAIVVVGRGAGESNDYIPGGLDASEKADGITEPLQLTPNEREIIKLATDNFDNVIVLLNNNSAIEVGDLKNDPKIKSILWVGHPGNYGTLGIADILCGNVSPSGSLYDIYATENLSAPAMQNMGDFTWSNIVVDGRTNKWEDGTTVRSKSLNYLMEAEGLYVGYRYYETRYFDSVYNQGNAKSQKGAYASSAGWNYAEEVAYGFGYGLSYSQFDYEIVGEPSLTVKPHEIYADVTVKVTNKGAADAKTSVQLYMHAPYTDYDRQHNVEKSAIQLVGFDKTDVLAKNGGSQTVTIKVDLQNVASYDASWQNDDGSKGSYILENGKYFFAVGNGAHDALNNVLAKQGKGVADGMDYAGKAALAKEWDYKYAGKGDVDYTTFGVSKNNQKISNQIDYIDWNNFGGEKITYLSRSDWDKTYPVKHDSLAAPSDMIPLLQGKIAASSDGKTYYKIKTDDDTSAIKWDSAETEYKFYQMVMSDWNDYRWDDLLKQINLEEATAFASNAGPSFLPLSGIDFVAISGGTDNAGNGIVFDLKASKDSNAPWTIKEGKDSNWNGQVFGCAPLVASSFNDEFMYEIGNFVGNEALFVGLPIVWGPGLNTHRHAYNGRNGEYYSEDPVLSGACAMEFATAARRKGLIAAPKHFVFNDQETNRNGVAPFMTEQRAREIELRAYQIGIEAVKYDGEGIIGLMTSFSKVGPVEVTNSWGMLTGILQKEWGFHGYAVTDISDDKDLYTGMVYAGCTGYDLRFGNPTSKDDFAAKIGAQADGIVLSPDMFKGDAEMQQIIKTSLKRTLWSFSQSNLMNRYSASTRVVWQMTWWRALYISLIVVFAVFTAAGIALYAVSVLKSKKEA
ncbi:MAG: beta-glucosidase [Clostridia bacterium]|nr:beta-glucosidase [Clostridia bacterium]